MSHHFKAKGGTVFNFNSDLSGPVHVWGPVHHDGSGVERAGVWSPEGDLLEFVEWYRRTPGYGVNEEALSETLTEEERRYLDGVAGDPREVFKDEVAKLLRLHDAQAQKIADLIDEIEVRQHNATVDEEALQARVKELEGLLDEAGNCMGLDAVDVVERISDTLKRASVDSPAVKT